MRDRRSCERVAVVPGSSATEERPLRFTATRTDWLVVASLVWTLLTGAALLYVLLAK
jgi:hypothetical protein